LPATLVNALATYFAAARYNADGDYVLAHPERGSKLDADWFAGEFRAALKAAGIDEYMRPFHDLRHASLTNGAAAGEQPLELMTRAGHRDMATTRQYLDLAGITFPDAAARLEERLLSGTSLYPSESISADDAPSEAPSEAAAGTP
jgi:integrase